MTDFAALRPGSVFASRYQIERLLKSGGMGAVYVARHTETGALHALKVMRPEIVRDPGLRQKFAQEAKVASLIESSHVVTVTDAGVDTASGIPFLVMELLRGQELGEFVQQQGRLAPAVVVDYLGQAARALDKAHARGIVHRDLKPENLFLVVSDEERPKVKILDFGIAKIVQSATHAASTQGGGTPLYMAPEQTKKSREIGPWTDIWALGLIAYALLVGRPYWEADTIGELYGEILSPVHEAATARAARAGVVLPPTFDAWFARCVSADPAHRFARVGEAVVALAVALGVAAGAFTPAPPQATLPMQAHTLPMQEPSWSGAPFTAGGSTTMPATQTQPRATSAPTRPRWIVPAAAASVIAVAVIAFAVTRSPRSGGESTSASGKTADVAALSASASQSAQPAAPSLAERVTASNPFVAVGSGSANNLQRHEITRAEYALWIESLPAAERPKARPLDDWSGEPIDAVSAKRPVTWVTHARAERFCKAIDARLPTSAEWSAALAGAKYPWGSTWPPPGKVSFDQQAGTLPDVESAAADKTASGVFDLFGSVREWAADVEDGFAAIRGASLGTPKAEAASAFASVTHKDVEEGADPGSHAGEIAAAQLGFRCAR